MATIGVERELEVKFRLMSSSDYFKVVEIFTEGCTNAPIVNMDRYFDSATGQLVSRGAYLRMRCSKRGCELTLKEVAKNIEAGVADRMETTLPLNALEVALLVTGHPSSMATAEHPEVVRFFEILKTKYGVTDIVEKGSMANIRIAVPLKGFEKTVIELDHVEYTNSIHESHRFYEVEVETSQPEVIKQHLISIFEKHGVEYTFSTLSKFERVTGLQVHP